MGCHVGEGHMARNQRRPLANIQQGTEALGPTSMEELDPANECRWREGSFRQACSPGLAAGDPEKLHPDS